MESNNLGCFSFVEVAADGITHLLAQLLQTFGFRENGFAKPARDESTFWRFLNHEDQFVHYFLAKSPFTLPRLTAIGRSLARISSADCLSATAYGFYPAGIL